MDYPKHYERLIERARNRLLEGYSERHHIIPKCLGGSNDPSNIVRLTPEEHYLAHQLLVKIHPGHRGLIAALIFMTGSGANHQRSNKLYGWARKLVAEAMANRVVSEETRQKLSLSIMGHTRNLGVPLTAERKAKISAAHMGKVSPTKGRPMSEETKAKLRKPKTEEHKQKLRKPQTEAHKKALRIVHATPEYKAKLSKAHKGKPKSAEMKRKLSAAKMGKPSNRKGVTLSPETKKKLSEAQQRRHAAKRSAIYEQASDGTNGSIERL